MPASGANGGAFGFALSEIAVRLRDGVFTQSCSHGALTSAMILSLRLNTPSWKHVGTHSPGLDLRGRKMDFQWTTDPLPDLHTERACDEPARDGMLSNSDISMGLYLSCSLEVHKGEHVR